MCIRDSYGNIRFVPPLFLLFPASPRAFPLLVFPLRLRPVSYTHLDVYKRQAEEWSAINIGPNNTPLTSANVYYYSDNLTDEQKADGNNYWRYVDGVPTVWTKETT